MKAFERKPRSKSFRFFLLAPQIRLKYIKRKKLKWKAIELHYITPAVSVGIPFGVVESELHI
jgi:hypothetical protein